MRRKHISTNAHLFSEAFVAIASSHQFVSIGAFSDFLYKVRPNLKLCSGTTTVRASKLRRELEKITLNSIFV